MEEAVLLEKARALLRRIYTEGAPMEDILTETDEPYLSWIGPRGREFFDSQDEVLKYDRSVSKKRKTAGLRGAPPRDECIPHRGRPCRRDGAVRSG